ncbi:hypothetical protein IMY05_C4822000200 [Salix suchowensis]|nr:hypothetical protein IMY05_C4822000200 [Salix suchowensis]
MGRITEAVLRQRRAMWRARITARRKRRMTTRTKAWPRTTSSNAMTIPVIIPQNPNHRGVYYLPPRRPLYDPPLPFGIQLLIATLCAALEVVNHRVGMRRRNNNNYHSKKPRSVGQAVQKDPRTANPINFGTNSFTTRLVLDTGADAKCELVDGDRTAATAGSQCTESAVLRVPVESTEPVRRVLRRRGGTGGTPSLVVAQCYQMGPGSKVDPLVMLNDAKRVCDTLVGTKIGICLRCADEGLQLANPSRLISSPPPPMYTVVPTLYPPQPMPTNASAGPSSTPATNGAPPVTSLPLVSRRTRRVSTFSIRAHIWQPVCPILPYSYPPGTAYFSATPQQPVAPGAAFPPTANARTTDTRATATATTSAQATSATSASIASTAATATATAIAATEPVNDTFSNDPTMTSTTPSGVSNPTMITGVGPGMQGSWSDEEVDRLRRLAEDSKSYNSVGEIDWDWLCRQWGHGRTRHESRPEREHRSGRQASAGYGSSDGSLVVIYTTTPHSANANIPSNIPGPDITAASASPAMSHATTTPTASPAMQNQPRPVAPPSKFHNSSSHSKYSATTSPSLPYPMPHVASSNAPVISTTPGAVDSQQRMSYYRQQRTGSESKHSAQSEMPPSKHPFMYQPPSGSSRMKDK